jgi:hypothetical protein
VQPITARAVVLPHARKLAVGGESYPARRQFKAGFSVHERLGNVVCYCVRAVSEQQQPLLIFPNGISPAEHIFNAHNVREGEFTLVRDPLVVLQAYEHGVENVVALITAIAPQSLEQLAAPHGREAVSDS